MEKLKIMYLIVILSLLYGECAESTLKEPLSAHHDSRLRRDISGDDGFTQVNDKSNVTNNPIYAHCSDKDDNCKKIEQLETKINELMGITKKQETNMEKMMKILNENMVQQKQANCGCAVKNPAFTGRSYLAIAAPPEAWRIINMTMKVKAAEPAADGIIMYWPTPTANTGTISFILLAVRQGRLEFRYYISGKSLIVVTADETLPANEWTNIEVCRFGALASLRINSGATLEGRLEVSWAFSTDTPIYIGGRGRGIDESKILSRYTAEYEGFIGCIKDVTLNGGPIDIVKAAIKSVNVQECCNSNDE